MKTSLLLILLACMGCAINSHKESATAWLRVPDGTPVELTTPEGTMVVTLEEQLVPVTYKSEVWQMLGLYFSKEKDLDHRTIFSSYEMGNREQIPDSNSIEASGELAGHAAKVIMGI